MTRRPVVTRVMQLGKKSRRPPNALVPTEHESQRALIEWCRLLEGRHPELALILAIPNGGHRHVAVARKLKAEGVRSGVPDLLLPVMRGGHGGLFVEMKRETGGRESTAQRWWRDRLTAEGYRVVCCAGFDAGKRALLEYLNLEPNGETPE